MSSTASPPTVVDRILLNHKARSSVQLYHLYIIERWYFQTRRCLYVASLFTCTRFLSLAGSIANNGNKQRKSHLGKRCVSPLLDIIERRNPSFVFGRGRIYLYLARSSDQDVSFASWQKIGRNTKFLQPRKSREENWTNWPTSNDRISKDRIGRRKIASWKLRFIA